MALPKSGVQLVVQGAAAFRSDLAGAAKDIGGFINTVGKGAAQFNVFGGAARAAGTELQILGRAFTYYTIYQFLGAMKEVTTTIFEQVGAYEMLEASLTSMVARDLVRAGSFKTVNEALASAAPIAQEVIKWMENLAVYSRFDLATIQNVYRLGSTYGFVKEQLQPLVGIMLDWGSANGLAEGDMEGAIRAFGQISQKGTVAGQEIKQLADHAVPALEYLSRGFNKSTAEIKKMVEEGAIPADIALQMIADGMRSDYAGATTRFAQTITGLTTSFTDLIAIDFREFGLGIADNLLPYFAMLVDWLDSDAIRAGFRAFGDYIGESIGDFIAWGAAILQTEDPLRTLANVVNTVIPGFTDLFDTLREVGPKLLEVAGAAFEWGLSIGTELASGLMAAASEILDAIGFIADIFTYWLEPGSPPRILPELDAWGAGWVDALAAGFKDADLSGLNDLANTMAAGLAPTPTGRSRDAGDSPADPVPAATAYVYAYKDMATATRDLKAAQDELKAAMTAFDAQLDPLKDKLDALNEAEKRAAEEKDLAKYRKILTGSYSPAKKREAEAAIEKILLQQQIRGLEHEKAVAKEAGEAKIDAIQTEIDAHKEVKAVKSAADKEAEKAAKEKEKADKAAKKAAEDAAEAEFKLKLARADTLGQIALYEEKLRGLEPGTKEYYDTQRAIVELQERYAKEQDRIAEQQTRDAEKEAKAQEQIRDAQLEADLAGKSHAERLAILQGELSKLTPGTKEYYDMLKRVRQEASALDKEEEAAAKKRDAAAKKHKGEGGAGAGAGSRFRPTWGGLDLTDISSKAEDVKGKLGGIVDKLNELNKSFTNVKETVEPLKAVFEGLAFVVGVTLVAAFGSFAISTLSATAPFLALAGAVAFLKYAWDTNLGGMQDMWREIWEGLLKPSLGLLGEALSRWLPDDVKSLSDAWEKVLKPALMEVWSFIVKYVMPAIGLLAAGFIVEAAGAIEGTRIVIMDVLIPAFQAIWEWITTKLMPELGRWVDFFKNDVPRAFDKFKADMFFYVIAPTAEFIDKLQFGLFIALEKVKEFFTVTIPGAFEDFQIGLKTYVIDPAGELNTWLTDTFFSTLSTLSTWFTETLATAIQNFKDKYITPFINAWLDIANGIGDVIAKGKELYEFLTSLTLPAISVDIDWPDPPDWYCDLFGCSPKPPPPHAKIYIDPTFSPPQTAGTYASPMSTQQAQMTGQQVANSYATTNNYNYSPTYGSGPMNEPRRNFDIMRTWGV